MTATQRLPAFRIDEFHAVIDNGEHHETLRSSLQRNGCYLEDSATDLMSGRDFRPRHGEAYWFAAIDSIACRSEHGLKTVSDIAALAGTARELPFYLPPESPFVFLDWLVSQKDCRRTYNKNWAFIISDRRYEEGFTIVLMRWFDDITEEMCRISVWDESVRAASLEHYDLKDCTFVMAYRPQG